MYISRIIQWLDRNMTSKKTISEMMLFNDSSNSLSSTSIVGEVRILYFYINMVLTK